jgi:AraC-like DNA-binding protein
MKDRKITNVDWLPAVATEPVSMEELTRHHSTHKSTFETLWNTTFHVLENGPLLPRSIDVTMQIARDARYRNDCKYSPGDEVRYFCYTLSGTGMFQDDSGTYPVPAGTGFLVEKDNPYATYYYPPGATEPWQYLGFDFHGLAAHAMTRALIHNYGSVYKLPPTTPIIKRLLAYEADGYRVTNIHVSDAAQLVIELLLALMAAGRRTEDTDPAIELVRNAITMLSGDEEIPIKDVARELGVSREHLSRCFHRRLGMSPRQFCFEQRVRRACFLLKNTDTPIKNIALQLGYSDYANFMHAFRQIMKMTPSDFRQHGALPLLQQYSGDRLE